MWELIKSNRRKSIVLFIGMGFILVLLGFVFGSYYDPDVGGYIGIFFAFLLWAILSSVSYFAGSKIILGISGAKEVNKSVHPQLFNIVEEMKIAANFPHFPKIYIIDSVAPNAFATGIKPEKSAIAVTAGLLSRLNRDELQGVVAHEMAHIVNRDVMLMTFAGMLLGSITLLSDIFVRSLWFGGGSRYRSKSKSSGQGQIIVLVLSIALAILGPIMAQIFYFAISRKREYLADASAVRLTRYPEGLASALEKISSNTAEIKSANKITAAMYIANPLKKKGQRLANLTSTHPPITERVKILRSLQHGVNYSNYVQAVSKVKGKKVDLFPAGILKETGALGIREASPESEIKQDVKTSQRAAGDLSMKLNNFSFIDCVCGLRLKVPPDFTKPYVFCPRCGTKHPAHPSH